MLDSRFGSFLYSFASSRSKRQVNNRRLASMILILVFCCKFDRAGYVSDVTAASLSKHLDADEISFWCYAVGRTSCSPSSMRAMAIGIFRAFRFNEIFS